MVLPDNSGLKSYLYLSVLSEKTKQKNKTKWMFLVSG